MDNILKAKHKFLSQILIPCITKDLKCIFVLHNVLPSKNQQDFESGISHVPGTLPQA